MDKSIFNPILVIRSLLENEQELNQEVDPNHPSQPNQPEDPIQVITKIEDPIKELIDHQIDVKNKKLEFDSNQVISNLINNA